MKNGTVNIEVKEGNVFISSKDYSKQQQHTLVAIALSKCDIKKGNSCLDLLAIHLICHDIAQLDTTYQGKIPKERREQFTNECIDIITEDIKDYRFLDVAFDIVSNAAEITRDDLAERMFYRKYEEPREIA